MEKPIIAKFFGYHPNNNNYGMAVQIIKDQFGKETLFDWAIKTDLLIFNNVKPGDWITFGVLGYTDAHDGSGKIGVGDEAVPFLPLLERLVEWGNKKDGSMGSVEMRLKEMNERYEKAKNYATGDCRDCHRYRNWGNEYCGTCGKKLT